MPHARASSELMKNEESLEKKSTFNQQSQFAKNMMSEAEDDDYQSDINSASYRSMTKRNEKSLSLSSRSGELTE